MIKDSEPGVRSLVSHREKQKAVRAMEVKRVLPENVQGKTCGGFGRYDLPYPCNEPAEYIICMLGSKSNLGWLYCGECLECALRRRLIAPPEEYVARECEQLEKQRRDAAYEAQRRRCAEHVGCQGHASKDPDGLCGQPPVARAGYSYVYWVVDAEGTSVRREDLRLYCARHLVKFRRRHDGVIIESLNTDPLPFDSAREAAR